MEVEETTESPKNGERPKELVIRIMGGGREEEASGGFYKKCKEKRKIKTFLFFLNKGGANLCAEGDLGEPGGMGRSSGKRGGEAAPAGERNPEFAKRLRVG